MKKARAEPFFSPQELANFIGNSLPHDMKPLCLVEVIEEHGQCRYTATVRLKAPRRRFVTLQASAAVYHTDEKSHAYTNDPCFHQTRDKLDSLWMDWQNARVMCVQMFNEILEKRGSV